MTQRATRRKTDDQVEQMHQEASALIETLRGRDNENMTLAPFGECVSGPEFLSCQVKKPGIFEKIGAKETMIGARWPGAYFQLEPQPNGARVTLHLPVLESVKASNKYKSNIAVHSGAPSTNWPMFLTMIDTVLGAILFYRINVYGFA